MARTPLMRSLRRLAAAQAQSRTRTVASRRAFLGLAGAAGASLLLAGPAFAAARRDGRRDRRIAVVGAGLAGMTAAYRLLQLGYDPVVFEAESALGGRVRTLRGHFAGSQRVERGGELIDTGHAAMRMLVRELGFTLDNLLAAEPPGTEPLFWFDGSPYTYAQASADFAPVFPRVQADAFLAGYPTTYLRSTPHGRTLDRLSIVDWIETRVPGGIRSKFGQLLDVAYNIEYGAESAEQSSLNLLYLLAYGSTPANFEIFGESDEKFRVAGGNDQVPKELEVRLGGRIRYGHALVAARTLPTGGTLLSFDAGTGRRQFLADRVVMTVPFKILRESVDLTHLDLAPVKRTAIAELQMGTNSKLHVQFASRFWNSQGVNGETYSDRGYQATWEESRAQSGAEGILVDYTGGAIGAGMGRGTVVQRAHAFLRQIEPVLPGATAQHNGRAWRDFWPAAPWQRGSYSYWRVGQYTRFAGVEREAEGAVHFAGEHTALSYQGYMNGSVQSAGRAAEEIRAALG